MLSSIEIQLWNYSAVLYRSSTTRSFHYKSVDMAIHNLRGMSSHPACDAIPGRHTLQVFMQVPFPSKVLWCSIHRLVQGTSFVGGSPRRFSLWTVSYRQSGEQGRHLGSVPHVSIDGMDLYIQIAFAPCHTLIWSKNTILWQEVKWCLSSHCILLAWLCQIGGDSVRPNRSINCRVC